MIGLYSIIKCPKCGIEIPICYGHYCGIGIEIEFEEDTICRDKKCMYEFKIDIPFLNQFKTIEVDWEDFKTIKNELVGIDSYDDYCKQLLNYIKNKIL